MADILEFLKNSILESERKAKLYARPTKRDIYNSLVEKPKFHVVYGLRGGGKTTLLFQRFLDYENGKRIYVSGDELNLLKISIYDIFKNLSYVMETTNGVIFLDEITKVENWAEQLKIAYDDHPELSIYVSGSSAIDLLSSKKVLARRAAYHNLFPMTFREYLKITKGIELKPFNLFADDIYTEIIRYDIYFKEKISDNPVDIVNDYANRNHPFMLEANEDMLADLVEKIIYEDIAKVYKFSSDVLNKFERLLFLLATSEKVTYDNLSKDLQLSKAIIGDMLRALVQSGLIKQVLPFGSGRIVGRKTWRYFFVVPAIRKLYMKKSGTDESIIRGYMREEIFVSHLQDVFYLPFGVDFVYKDMVFEVGGKSKGTDQFKNKKGFIVYDGVEISRHEKVIKFPFYIFLSHL